MLSLLTPRRVVETFVVDFLSPKLSLRRSRCPCSPLAAELRL